MLTVTGSTLTDKFQVSLVAHSRVFIFVVDCAPLVDDQLFVLQRSSSSINVTKLDCFNFFFFVDLSFLIILS